MVDGQVIPCVFCQPKRSIHPRDSKHIVDLQGEVMGLTEIVWQFELYLSRRPPDRPRPSRWHPIQRIAYDGIVSARSADCAAHRAFFVRTVPPALRRR